MTDVIYTLDLLDRLTGIFRRPDAHWAEGGRKSGTPTRHETRMVEPTFLPRFTAHSAEQRIGPA